jgi:hypothetical protein
MRLTLTVAMALLAAGTLPSRAEISSDQPAAIVMFPKLIVDIDNGIDTLVRLSNTSDSPLTLHCLWIDATPRCVNGEGSCVVGVGQEGRCTGQCIEDRWNETDFRIIITGRQPIGWRISQGMRDCRSTADPNQPCFQLDGITRRGPGGQSNQGSNILPVPHDEFVGYLQCIAVDETGAPVERNDLKGEALMVRTNPPSATKGEKFADVDGYNGIAFQAIAGTNDRDRTLCLGGCIPIPGSQCVPNDHCPNGPEYDGCPNILILDHFFDGAVDPIAELPVVTDLTLVPCSQDYLRQSPERTTVQFLVFNEFEQRFSTSRPVTCFKEIQISRIDTDFNSNSIFSAGVNGTMTGQTRIRGVADEHTGHGHALVGIAREFRCTADSPLATCAAVSTASFNLHSQGRRPQADLILLPPE